MMKQYELWLANLNPARGTESGKIRPVVIIQTNLLNQTNHPSTLICPITTNLSTEANILRVTLDKTESGLDQESEVLIDQIRALDNRRLIEKLGSLNAKQASELRIKLKAILDF